MDIGQNIKTYRKNKGLSLTKVAELTGYSVSFLSQIERNIANPSINSLKKISDVLGIQLAYFFNDQENGQTDEKQYVVRTYNRKKLANQESKVEMYLLSPNLNNKIELILIIAQPGGKSGDYYRHKGEECGFVIKGSLCLDLGGQSFDLDEGDTIQFNCDTPHKWKNKGLDVSVSLWAITPPSY